MENLKHDLDGFTRTHRVIGISLDTSWVWSAVLIASLITAVALGGSTFWYSRLGAYEMVVVDRGIECITRKGTCLRDRTGRSG